MVMARARRIKLRWTIVTQVEPTFTYLIPLNDYIIAHHIIKVLRFV